MWELVSYAILEITVFSNILKDTQIHILADSDEHEVVQQLQVIPQSLKCLFCLALEQLCIWYSWLLIELRDRVLFGVTAFKKSNMNGDLRGKLG